MFFLVVFLLLRHREITLFSEPFNLIQLFNRDQGTLILDFGSSKVNESDSEISSKDNVLRLDVSVNNSVGVEVVEGLYNLGKVVYHDAFLLKG